MAWTEANFCNDFIRRNRNIAHSMLGSRGSSRYYSDLYRDGFALECRVLKRVRENLGFDNVVVMVPFCRTPAEAHRVLAIMANNGLRRGTGGLQIYMICEIPSNVILAPEFARRFDGFSIGSNDLTQLVLGVDRDSDLLAHLFDERDEAVRSMIAQAIEQAHIAEIKIGICSQAPSTYPEFVKFLGDANIDSISLNPDSFVRTIQSIAEAERASSRPAMAGCSGALRIPPDGPTTEDGHGRSAQRSDGVMLSCVQRN